MMFLKQLGIHTEKWKGEVNGRATSKTKSYKQPVPVGLKSAKF